MTPVLCDLDKLGWRVTSQLPKTFWLYLRKENRHRVCFNGTNQAETKCADLERFGQHGVESDVTYGVCDIEKKWYLYIFWDFFDNDNQTIFCRVCYCADI